MKSKIHYATLIVGIIGLIAAAFVDDQLFAQAATAITVDPYDVDIDEVEDEEGLELLERAFMKAPRTRRILPHYHRYFVHLCNVELRQLHSLTNLRRSEFEQIQEELAVVSRRATLKMCQDVLRGRPGATSAIPPNNTASVTLIVDTLIELADRDLTIKQAKRYRDEVLARRTFRREAVVEAMAASLDRHVLLSIEQRQQLIELLLSEWQDQWLLCSRQLVSSGIESIPMLPMAKFRNLLKPPQIKVFASLKWNPKTVVFGSSNHLVQAGQRQLKVTLIKELTFAPEDEGARK